MVGYQFQLQGVFWNTIADLNDNFGVLGYVIIGIFVLSWMISILFYKLNRYDEIEVNFSE